MFRRDKDNKLDTEGLRRMREAIRQRLEQEEATTGEQTREEPSYRTPTPGAGNSDTYTPANTFDPSPRERDTEYSFLNTSRQERTLLPGNAPTADEVEAQPWPSNERAAVEATLVAADTLWRGMLRSSGPIRIEGTFEGQIDTEQALHIAPNARVEATVHAASIVVAGQLNGQINCRERLEVMPSGRVSGQIDAGRFVVHEGAFLGGQVRMRPSGDAGNDGDDSRPMLQRVR